ncbi:MAG: DUF6544 family protein [Gemmatimonadota bacterium]|nr:DUF6544 family protein [Gemmatimonadota bacterium]
MRWVFVALLLLHGAIHGMGAAKAFQWGELSALRQPISRGMGVVWTGAGILFMVAAGLVAARSRVWWAPAAVAVVLSQWGIIASWSDARFGTLANLVIAAAAVYGFASLGPLGLRAGYERAVRARMAAPAPAPDVATGVVTDAHLAHLPEPVQRYLRVTGVVGQPMIAHVRARWRGRIRGGPDDPWMTFTAEQHNFPGEPARFFFMDARRSGLPVDVFHAFEGNAATMRVRLASLVPMVSASGAEITRAETVTLLNDWCLIAPTALLDPAIRWEPIDARSARARYTVGANTITAVLWFNDAGELVNFTTDDRLAQAEGGAAWTRQPWSTPVGEYRHYGAWRLASRGEGRWHAPGGVFAYIEMELLDVQVGQTQDGR